MVTSLLADAVVLLHLGFILFVIFGGLLVLWRRWMAWLHLPAAAWGAWVSAAGWICPLTPFENWLRAHAGEVGYTGDFTSHYIMPLIYPEGLTRELQIVVAIIVLVVNAAVYAIVIRQSRGARR
jgi:hypothetical protein